MDKSNKMALQRILSATGNPQAKAPTVNMSKSSVANSITLENKSIVSSPRKKIHETRGQPHFYESTHRISLVQVEPQETGKTIARTPSFDRQTPAESASFMQRSQAEVQAQNLSHLKQFLNGVQSKALKSATLQVNLGHSIKVSPKKAGALMKAGQETCSGAKMNKDVSCQLNSSYGSAECLEVGMQLQQASTKQIQVHDGHAPSGTRQIPQKAGIMIESAGGPLKLKTNQGFGAKNLLESLKRTGASQITGLRTVGYVCSPKAAKGERLPGVMCKSPQPQRLLASPSTESYSSAICVSGSGGFGRLKSGNHFHFSPPPHSRPGLLSGQPRASQLGLASKKVGTREQSALASPSGVRGKTDHSFLSDGAIKREASRGLTLPANSLYSPHKVDGGAPGDTPAQGVGLFKSKEIMLSLTRPPKESSANYGLLQADNKKVGAPATHKPKHHLSAANKKLKGSFEKGVNDLHNPLLSVLRNCSSGGQMVKMIEKSTSQTDICFKSQNLPMLGPVVDSEESCDENLDSSIENIEEEREAETEVGETQKQQETTVNETILVRKTQGTFSNTSKSVCNERSRVSSSKGEQKKTSHTPQSRDRSVSKLGIFEDLVLKTRKEPSTKGDDQVYSQQIGYYTDKIVRILKEHPKLTDDSPPQVILYHNHFRIMTQSYTLARALKQPSETFLTERAVHLPPNHFSRMRLDPEKKTLVLDLDETLVHCVDSLAEPHDLRIEFTCSDGNYSQVSYPLSQSGINLRPGLQEFLLKVNLHYEIVIFTAAKINYANEVLALIDPKNELITARIFKDHCYQAAEHYLIKDLRIIKNRDPASIVIVDNFAYSYAMQFENGIPIVPFFTDKLDNELQLLGDYLLRLAGEPDVRPLIKRDFHVDLFKKLCPMPDVLVAKLVEAELHKQRENR